LLKQKFDTVPWTINQTFNGVFFTLLPWIAFLAANAFLSAHMGVSAQSTMPLSFQMDSENAIVTLLFSLLVYCVFLAAPLYYARRSQRTSTTDTRSVWQLLGFRHFNVGYAIVLVLIALVIIILLNQVYSFLITFFHWNLQTNDEVVLKNARLEPITTYVSLFVAVFIAPFCEEVFFRSFTFMGLKNGMTLSVAIIMSALIFGVAHGDPASFPVLVCIGIALALLRMLTGSYWPGLMLHLLNNALSALLVILAMHGINM
jgi:membrane protease YdiL (CAAX protease family)